MKTTIRYVLPLVVALALFGATTHPAFAEDKAPAFMEVGKKYRTLVSIAPITFVVLDLGKDAWVKIRIIEEEDEAGDKTKKDDVAWLNTKAALIIEPVEDQKKEKKDKK